MRSSVDQINWILQVCDKLYRVGRKIKISATMDYLHVLASILIIFLSIYYFYKKLTLYDKYQIPYIKPLPIIGNMIQPIFRLTSMADFIHKIYNFNPTAKYIGIFDFFRPTIVIRDPELIKDITIKYFDNFVDHLSLGNPELDPLFGNNLFSLRGNKWREMRNLLSPSFTSSKMKKMFNLMLECSKNFSNYWVETLQHDEVTNINARDAFTKYTTDVIATCAFGITTDSMRDPENEFYVIGSRSCHFQGLRGVKFFVLRSFPLIAKLFKIRLMPDELHEFFCRIVRETIKMRKEKGITRPDMIQLMMEAQSKSGKELSIEEMTSQAFVFFFAGFDTTSALMCFMAHMLAVNPDVQQKLRNEIDEIYQQCQGDVTYENIKNMEYLDAIINETLRFHPIAFSLDRVCTKSYQLPPAIPEGKPYHLKPGDSVWIPVSGLHRDPAYFPDPDKFMPERFIDNSKSLLNSLTYIPFGVGPRICIGNRFALLETKVLFFYLIHDCVLKPGKKMKLPLKYEKNLSLSAEGGFWLDIEPRKR